jgi:hypothetical protein
MCQSLPLNLYLSPLNLPRCCVELGTARNAAGVVHEQVKTAPETSLELCWPCQLVSLSCICA